MRKILSILMIVICFGLFGCFDKKQEELKSYPLIEAAENIDFEKIQILLDKDFSLIYETRNGYSFLDAVISGTKKFQDLDFLLNVLNYLPDDFLNTSDSVGDLPLVKFLSQYPDFDVIKLMLERTININLVDDKGMTPLMWAAANADKDVVNLLIENGADITVFNNNTDEGLSVLMYACQYNDKENVENLIGKGAVQTESKIGRTLLMQASLNRNFGSEIISFLINQNNLYESIDFQDINGQTALMFACKESNKEAVSTLIKYKANVLLKNKYGKTALMYACENNTDLNIINLLIKQKAKLFKEKDSNGKSAFQYMWKNSKLQKYKVSLIVVLLIFIFIIVRPISLFKYFILNEPIKRPSVIDIWTKDN